VTREVPRSTIRAMSKRKYPYGRLSQELLRLYFAQLVICVHDELVELPARHDDEFSMLPKAGFKPLQLEGPSFEMSLRCDVVESVHQYWDAVD